MPEIFEAIPGDLKKRILTHYSEFIDMAYRSEESGYKAMPYAVRSAIAEFTDELTALGYDPIEAVAWVLNLRPTLNDLINNRSSRPIVFVRH